MEATTISHGHHRKKPHYTAISDIIHSMGYLEHGKWQDKWYNTEKTGGQFIREASKFRSWINNEGQFKPEANRYHLYVSYACPWASRTLIFRKLKSLEGVISYSTVHPHMMEQGWEFCEGESKDPLYNHRYLHEIYTKADSTYTGRVTVPVLWDKQLETIVNNESAEIIRMLNSEFDEFTNSATDYYPNKLHKEIDVINEFIYKNINNRVYRCGFATKQQTYEKAYDDLFDALEQIETILSQHRYLVDNILTEADWRLFVTLVRFDPVYYSHFKCNKKRIMDYPNLSNYLRDLYQYPGIAETVRFDHIKDHYYYSHPTINPTRIVPKGPEIDLNLPHNRNRFK